VYCQELPLQLRSLCRRVSSLSMQVISRGEGRRERERGRNVHGKWTGSEGKSELKDCLLIDTRLASPVGCSWQVL